MSSEPAISAAATWGAVMAFVLGLLLAADYGVTASIHHTLSARSAEEWGTRWKCPPDELEEERVSLAECQAMAARVEGIVVARPGWFAGSQILIGVAGAMLALASALAAVAFMDGRRWAVKAFLASIAGLLALDLAQLSLASLTGPLLRSDHLWKYGVWLMIHAALMSALLHAVRSRPSIAALPARAHSRSAAVLHFLVGASIIFLYPLSWWFMALPWGQARGFPTQLHKNLGLTVAILLVVLLLARRSANAAHETLPRWMAGAAAWLHVSLYVTALLVAVSGYLSSAFSGWPTRLWWLVDLPSWGWEDEELNALFSDAHIMSAWVLFGLVVAHIAAALWHALRSDGVVRRMLHW